MRRFTKTELKHLKFKLMNEKGLTNKEADKRLKELVKYERKLDMKGGNIKNGKKRTPTRNGRPTIREWPILTTGGKVGNE